MPLNYSFAGRKVLVTGGANGIGYAISKSFYEDGAILFVIDKNQVLLDELKTKMPNATTVCLDLLNWDATREVITKFGPLDHLINNAGIVISSSLLEATESDFDTLFGVNVKQVLNCSIAFTNTIKEAIDNGSDTGRGRTIVNISSVASRLALKGLGIYCSTKAAVTMFTKSMAIEFSTYKIRVNAMCPGFIATDLLRSIRPDIIAELENIYNPRVMIEEPIQTTDIANGVLFLSSPLSAKTTGETIFAESGISTH